MTTAQPTATATTSVREQTCEAYREYARRQESRDYSPETIGSVVTLDDRWRDLPGPSHPKIEAVWDGPLRFPPSPDPTRPYVLLMFVTALGGKVSLENPGDIGGGETDWWLYREAVRWDVDAVAGGAGTLRGEPKTTFSLYDPELVASRVRDLGKPRHPFQVIISGSGNLEIDREYLLAVPEFTTFVLTSDAGRAALGIVGRDGKIPVSIGPSPRELDLSQGLRILRQTYRVKRLLVVGGAEVATSLLEHGLVDEIFLTQSARLLGGSERRTFFEGTGFSPGGGHDTRLMTVKRGKSPWDDTLFLRYAVPYAQQWVPKSPERRGS